MKCAKCGGDAFERPGHGPDEFADLVYRQCRSCGNVTSTRKKPPKKCKPCRDYFARFSCGMAVYLECDCPKCQGYCKCRVS